MTCPDHVKLWRYMDLWKLLDLLSTRQLHLARLDSFEDPYEAHLSKRTEKLMTRRSDAEAPLLFDRTRYCVNCWHINNEQSAAMWTLYANKSGIAITCCLSNLLSSIGVVPSQAAESNIIRGEIEVEIGPGHTVPTTVRFDEVRYFDVANGLNSEMYDGERHLPPWLCKRLSFSHEKEFRLAVDTSPFAERNPYWDQEHNEVLPKFCRLNIDLAKLQPTIFISPYNEAWTVSALRSLLDAYNIQSTVERSTLYDAAIK